VVAHIRQFLIKEQGGSSADPTYIEILLKFTILWLVGQIIDLSSRGLRHRSWELLLLCTIFQMHFNNWFLMSIGGRSIPFYKKLKSHAKDFSNKVTICAPPVVEAQASGIFDLPFLMKYILGESVR
jgi:hypothetical protein